MKELQPKGAFTAELWLNIEDLLNKIQNCDFVINLSNGTLEQWCFAHYLSQDVLYLRQDNEALELLSQKAEEEKQRAFFHKLSQDGLDVEKALHDEYLKYFNVIEATSQSPAFSAYGEFILNHARFSSYPVAVAALLPCFWVYAKVGIGISRNSVNNNKYQRFIDTYSGAEYESYVEQFIEIIEELGQKETSEIQTKMKIAFIKSTEFELKVFEESFALST